MPSITLAHRHESAVLWAATVPDKYGIMQVAAPVDLSPAEYTGVRFVNTDAIILSPTGDSVKLDKKVVLDRYPPMGSIIWPGTIATLPSSGEFPADNPLLEFVSMSTAKDIKGRDVRWEGGLIKYSRKLPTIGG